MTAEQPPDEVAGDEAQCWREFWEILGAEAYRLWRQDQSPSAEAS